MKITMAHVKKSLAAAFPDVTFEYGTSGRGHQRGPCVGWEGGPSEAEVGAAAPRLTHGYHISRHLHFHRRMTPAEVEAYMAAEDARDEAERPAREAAEKARRAAAKADGIAKAAKTRERKAALAKRLAEAFPEVQFDIAWFKHWPVLNWTGGPSREEVEAATRADLWKCTRAPSLEEISERRNVVEQLRTRGHDAPYWEPTETLRTRLETHKARERKAAAVRRIVELFAVPQTIPPPARPLRMPLLPLHLPRWFSKDTMGLQTRPSRAISLN